MNSRSLRLLSLARSSRIPTIFLAAQLATAFVLTGGVLSATAQQPNNAPQEPYTPPPPPPPPSAQESQPAPAPEASPAPSSLGPKQLDDLVSRIALYPDPLLAQILSASTYENQIPDAAGWANEHHELHGQALADAIREDNLPWDPSVIALLPFPSVLGMMAQDQHWTQELGDAVLAQRSDIMDAVQRMRHQSYQYGYLRSNDYDRVVDEENDIEILPVNPAYVYVPFYDPLVVFGPPRPGIFIGGVVRFGPAIVVGAPFFAWGWAHPYFGWRTHSIFFDATPWNRGWVNRGYYVHPYAHPYVRAAGPRVERHEFHRR